MSTKPRSDCRPRHSLPLILLLSLSLFTIPAPPRGRTAPATPEITAAPASHAPAPSAPAQEAALTSHLNVYAVNDANQLLIFRSDTPGTIDATLPITGLQAGELVSALDFSPFTGELYGLAITNPGPGDDALRFYEIDARTGAATLIKTFLGMPDGASYGLEINPQNSEVRVVNTADQNLRFLPNSGSQVIADTNLNDPAGAETVVGLAYDRNDINPNTPTTLFGIDTSVNRLVRVGGVDGTPSPNGGVLSAVGPLGVQIGSNQVGFDIAGANAAYASLQNLLTGSFNLYTVNLTTGDATAVGAIGNGTAVIRGLAVQPPAEIVLSSTTELHNVIRLANNLPGPNTITFNIPGPGPHNIGPSTVSPLPTITETLTIDGTTQPGYAGMPLIEISGVAAGNVSGLVITAGSSAVRGLAINRFAQHGIVLRGGGNVVTGCYIGTDPAGVTDLGNGGDGIRIEGGSTGNVIGGEAATPGTGPGNIISGNDGNGITISGSPQNANTFVSNLIIGNLIGTDKTGTADLGNTLDGVAITDGSLFTHIGGPAPTPGTGRGNVISGNNRHGISIGGATPGGSPSRLSSILGNLIGTNAAGTAALGNGGDGVSIADGSSSNLVGGNPTTPGDGNVISGNGSDGVEIRGATTGGNAVRNSLIGTNAAGAAALGNGEAGIRIDNARVNEIGRGRNIISGNPTGILINGAGAQFNSVLANYIGTNKAGAAPLGNMVGILITDAGSTFIGSIDFTFGSGNLISGNGTGISLQGLNTTRTTLRSNLIGTDATGTARLGNGVGVLIGSNASNNFVGDPGGGGGNIISGNAGSGGRGAVSIESGGNFVLGNRIGTDITGALPLGNVNAGVELRGAANVVGGPLTSLSNLIAFNGGPGVLVDTLNAIANSIRLNSMHSNAGLGIDLTPLGPTPNDPGDADIGPNGLQNFPTLNAVTSTGSTAVQGVLNTTPNTTFYLDFYATTDVGPGGICEGRAYVGSAILGTDAGGNAPFNFSFPAVLSPGTHVTATATSIEGLLSEGSTSEFSPCVAVNSTAPTPTPTPTPTPGTASLQLSSAAYRANEDAGFIQITVTRTGDMSSAAAVDYATTDGTADDRGDYTTAIGRLRFAAGENARSFLVFLTDDRFVEGEESFQVALSNPTGGAALGSTVTATLTINDNDDAPSPDNPADLTAFFVRQHYIDFLNRAPDPDGFAFWVSNIETCGADMACRERQRVDTSAAFFLSIEFQETGFLVHRLYRAGLNRFPRYREFIRDARELGRGVVVGRTGWEELLAANQQSLAEEFAARPEFTMEHGALSNAQYVDALNANAGGALSAAERNALVAGLDGGTETRASALLKVAGDADFIARERNPAFVLAQYFGYLRRNPDDPPDTDFAGFDFWLQKLNSFGGDFRRAELVRAFIVSLEYRQRFGQ